MLVMILCGLAALVAGSPIDDGVNKLANGTEGYYKTYLFLKSVVLFGLKVHLLTNNLKGAFLLPDIEPFSYQRKVKIGHRKRIETENKAKCRRFGLGVKIECRTRKFVCECVALCT